MECSNQAPPIAAKVYPRNPNAGKPNNSGQPLTVMIMEEPIMSVSVTIPIAGAGRVELNVRLDAKIKEIRSSLWVAQSISNNSILTEWFPGE
jgi:hypothetical protein